MAAAVVCWILFALLALIACFVFVCYPTLPQDLDDRRKSLFLFPLMGLFDVFGKFFGYNAWVLWLRKLERSDYVTETRQQDGVKVSDTVY